jgi:hypothetical protein
LDEARIQAIRAEEQAIRIAKEEALYNHKIPEWCNSLKAKRKCPN